MTKMVKRFFFSLLAIFLIFQEWLWDVLSIVGRKLAVWLHLQRFEHWLRESPRHIALIAFAIPLIIVTPINLTAFWMIAKGIIIRGILLEIFTKLVGTVLIARIFNLTKPQLLTYGWFSWLYHLITGWLNWAHVRIRNTAIYRSAQQVKSRLRAILRRGQ